MVDDLILDYCPKPCSQRPTAMVRSDAALSLAVSKEKMPEHAARQLTCFLMSRANPVCDVIDVGVVKREEPIPGRYERTRRSDTGLRRSC